MLFSWGDVGGRWHAQKRSNRDFY